MSKIFVISDTHFGHENIIGYCQRPFSDIYDMNEHMIERWNSVVSEQDKVYHLGDVYMGSASYAGEVLARLNGKKRLILGNHDNGRDQTLHKYFKKISMWRMFKEYGVLLTHVPVHESTLREGRFDGSDRKIINIHGHIHTNKSPDGPYRCACVEQIDYTPREISYFLD